MWLLTVTLGLSGAVVFVIGSLGVQGRLPRNRWAGIRSRWAMASDRSWKVAHEAAGRMLMLSGFVVVALAVALPVVGEDSPGGIEGIALAGCGVMVVGGWIAARSARRAVGQ